MSAIASIGGLYAGAAWPQVYGATGAGDVASTGAAAAQAGVAVSASQSLASLSATSISATSESLIATLTPSANNNELLGAVLLMLIMEYLKTDDKQEKQGIMGLVSALLQQQQQQSAGAETLMYSSTSYSYESVQMQMMSTDMALAAYSGASATLQQAPSIDAGAAGLNVLA